MREITFTSNFKKTAKKHKNEYDKKELVSILKQIANKEPLDQRLKDHRLKAPWRKGDKLPFREFHITNRLVVVYLITDTTVEVHALGTHKELNLGESFVYK